LLERIDLYNRQTALLCLTPKGFAEIAFTSDRSIPDDNRQDGLIQFACESHGFVQHGAIGGVIGVRIVCGATEHNQIAGVFNLVQDAIVAGAPLLGSIDDRGLTKSIPCKWQHNAPANPELPSGFQGQQIGATRSRANQSVRLASLERFADSPPHQRDIRGRKSWRVRILGIDSSTCQGNNHGALHYSARARSTYNRKYLSGKVRCMTREEIILAAKEALGAERTDDYRIRPTRHAEELAAKAPGLAAMLRTSELSTLAEQYDLKDAEADEKQSLFKSTASRANWAVFSSACFSALLLASVPLKSLAPGISGNGLVTVFGVCGVIAAGLGTMWLFRVREGKLLDNWMRARAAAEALRAQYFETVIGLESSRSSSPIPLPLLQFEYFRRYQLDVQIAYYSKRAADHGRDAAQFMRISEGAVALACISTGLAAVLGGRNEGWISVAALGSVATALSSFASTREAVNQSRRNMERYANAGDSLMLLKRRLDDIRGAAMDGHREPAKQFVAAIHEQISLEHRQWLAAAQSIQPAIEKLDATLSKLKSKPTESQLSASAQAPQ
jgi:hypothetical protein